MRHIRVSYPWASRCTSMPLFRDDDRWKRGPRSMKLPPTLSGRLASCCQSEKSIQSLKDAITMQIRISHINRMFLPRFPLVSLCHVTEAFFTPQPANHVR